MGKSNTIVININLNIHMYFSVIMWSCTLHSELHQEMHFLLFLLLLVNRRVQMHISSMWQVAQLKWIYKKSKSSTYMASVYVHFLQLWHGYYLECSCVHPRLGAAGTSNGSLFQSWTVLVSREYLYASICEW